MRIKRVSNLKESIKLDDKYSFIGVEPLVFLDAVINSDKKREARKKAEEGDIKSIKDFKSRTADRRNVPLPVTADMKKMGLLEKFIKGKFTKSLLEKRNGRLRLIVEKVNEAGPAIRFAIKEGIGYKLSKLKKGYAVTFSNNSKLIEGKNKYKRSNIKESVEPQTFIVKYDLDGKEGLRSKVKAKSAEEAINKLNKFKKGKATNINVVTTEKLKEARDDSNMMIYLFPIDDFTDKDLRAMKIYNLTILGKNYFENESNYVVRGRKEDIYSYAKDYLGYEIHPDYLYNEYDFGGNIIKTNDKKFREYHIEGLQKLGYDFVEDENNIQEFISSRGDVVIMIDNENMSAVKFRADNVEPMKFTRREAEILKEDGYEIEPSNRKFINSLNLEEALKEYSMRIKQSEAYKEGLRDGRGMWETGHGTDISQDDEVKQVLKDYDIPRTKKNINDYIEGFLDGHAQAQSKLDESRENSLAYQEGFKSGKLEWEEGGQVNIMDKEAVRKHLEEISIKPTDSNIRDFTKGFRDGYWENKYDHFMRTEELEESKGLKEDKEGLPRLWKDAETKLRDLFQGLKKNSTTIDRIRRDIKAPNIDNLFVVVDTNNEQKMIGDVRSIVNSKRPQIEKIYKNSLAGVNVIRSSRSTANGKASVTISLKFSSPNWGRGVINEAKEDEENPNADFLLEISDAGKSEELEKLLEDIFEDTSDKEAIKEFIATNIDWIKAMLEMDEE